MEEILMQVAKTARQEEAVAMQPLTNGLQLLVYPMPDGMVVGLGVTAEFAHEVRMETVVRKRSENLPRYSAWQPAVFNDGSCYVLRRVLDANLERDQPVLSDDDLVAAEELLT